MIADEHRDAAIGVSRRHQDDHANGRRGHPNEKSHDGTITGFRFYIGFQTEGRMNMIGR